MTESDSKKDDGTTLIGVAEACKRLAVSKWTLYRLIRERKMKSVKIGGRRLILVSAIAQYIEERLKVELDH